MGSGKINEYIPDRGDETIATSAAAASGTQIIAIYGKGGIGKSFTLANLSYMMAQQGKKVLLIIDEAQLLTQEMLEELRGEDEPAHVAELDEERDLLPGRVYPVGRLDDLLDGGALLHGVEHRL